MTKRNILTAAVAALGALAIAFTLVLSPPTQQVEAQLGAINGGDLLFCTCLYRGDKDSRAIRRAECDIAADDAEPPYNAGTLRPITPNETIQFKDQEVDLLALCRKQVLCAAEAVNMVCVGHPGRI